MLDFDLAEMYEVETRALNQAIKRNLENFPDDFMFRLNADEWQYSSSQIVMMSSQSVMTSKKPKSALPYAFAEHGVTMLASILKSPKARQVNIAIVRAFVSLRKTLINIDNLTNDLESLETKYDSQFADIFDAIQFLMTQNKEHDTQQERTKIGFKKLAKAEITKI